MYYYITMLSGHAVNKLTKHKDKDVSSLATQIVKSWKRHFKEKLDRPMIEVKSDRKTEGIRQSARNLLASALQVSSVSMPGQLLPT